jgi:signal peptidase I
MIKRLAALPGESVPPMAVPADTGPGAEVVPPRMLVLLGDNPDSSYDSREFGYFPAERLLGVVMRQLRSGPAALTGPAAR